MGFGKVMAKTDSSTENSDWATPQYVFDKLNEEFHFTIDVAASSTNHKCDRYYTIDDDGLSKDWNGETVWCNPPYNGHIRDWVKKASEMTSGLAVFLIPSRTETTWFHDYIYGKEEVRFIRGRLKFGGSKTCAPFGSMVVVFRRDSDCQHKETKE